MSEVLTEEEDRKSEPLRWLMLGPSLMIGVGGVNLYREFFEGNFDGGIQVLVPGLFNSLFVWAILAETARRRPWLAIGMALSALVALYVAEQFVNESPLAKPIEQGGIDSSAYPSPYENSHDPVFAANDITHNHFVDHPGHGSIDVYTIDGHKYVVDNIDGKLYVVDENLRTHSATPDDIRKFNSATGGHVPL